MPSAVLALGSPIILTWPQPWNGQYTDKKFCRSYNEGRDGSTIRRGKDIFRKIE